MIDGLRPYAEMHETGLPWLGDVPAHWDVRRNGRLFGARRETGFPDLPVLEVSIRSGVRIRNFDNGGRKQEMTDHSKYQRAVRGDIAYNMMRMWQGAVGIAPADGLVSPAYVVARPFPEADAAYYAYLFRTAAYMREIDVFSRGIVPDRNRLYWESFKQMPSVHPPLDEQRLIVRFLDWHGAQTAKLVRAKKKIIALLNEQKQAIIHRAVTRSLDPNAKLKPSGIPWLGDVPEGWEVKRLKNVCRINPSKLAIKSRAADELATFLPMERVSSDGNIDGSIQAPISELANGFTYFERGDVILAKITPCFENGKGAVLEALPTEVGFGSTEFIVLRASRKIDPRFLYLLTFEAQFRRLGVESMTGSAGQQRISQEFVANYCIALPGRDEQVRIIEALKAATREFDAVIGSAFREIALIQEFRTRLIADVVTGKLDVRAAAASLPEVTDIEPADDLVEGDDLGEAIDDIENEEVAA
jgi:type I restriction enzyme S subunit